MKINRSDKRGLMQQITNNAGAGNSSTADQEVLVKVEGVSKKFCRSLKKSLWYGLCDIAGELNPFRRQVAEVAGSGSLVAGNGSKPDSSELATSNSPPVTGEAGLRPGEFYAVRDVSFELKRGEPGGEVAARRIGTSQPGGRDEREANESMSRTHRAQWGGDPGGHGRTEDCRRQPGG